MKRNSIDINQRIPLDVLHIGFVNLLNNNYSEEYLLEQLRLDYKGENRLKKSMRIVNRILVKSPLENLIHEKAESFKQALKSKVDRNIILISLLNAAFPFSYAVLSVFGKFFNVQDVINAETIKKAISATYGGNRATENGIYSVVPMFLEADFFSRPKIGVYEANVPLIPNFDISKEAYQWSFSLNNEIEEIQPMHLMDPYFVFVD